MGKGDLSKFKGEGFHTWQTKVKGYLMKKNLWSIVKPNPAGEEGTSTRTSTAQTRDRDEQALGIIITSLDDAYIHYIDDASTAQQEWGILEYMFGAKGKRSKIGLKMQLYKLTLHQSEDIASLINRLQSIITQLVYIQAPVDEEDKVAVLLNVLPEAYNQIVTILQEKEPAPKLEDAINSIQEESNLIKVHPLQRGKPSWFLQRLEDARSARGQTTTPKIATQRRHAPSARKLDIRQQTDATSKTKTKTNLQRRTKVKLTSLKNPTMRLTLFMSLMMTFCKSFKSLLKRTLCTQKEHKSPKGAKTPSS